MDDTVADALPGDGGGAAGAAGAEHPALAAPSHRPTPQRERDPVPPLRDTRPRVAVVLLAGRSALGAAAWEDGLACLQRALGPEACVVAWLPVAGDPDRWVLPRELAVLVGGGDAQCVRERQSAGGQALMRWIGQCASQGVSLVGSDGGAAWLADSGVLDGHRACSGRVHPADPCLQRPGVVWVPAAWDASVDERRWTDAGGVSCLELLLRWVESREGANLAQVLAAQLHLPFRPAAQVAREPDDVAMADDEPVPSKPLGGMASGRYPPRLQEALELMWANLAEPLSTEEIARLVGLSRRQIERLFKQYLDTLPSRHYLGLRLQQAQQLLLNSSESILQIGLSCGFSSGPHFSNAYKACFGHTPREARNRSPRPCTRTMTPR